VLKDNESGDGMTKETDDGDECYAVLLIIYHVSNKCAKRMKG